MASVSPQSPFFHSAASFSSSSSKPTPRKGCFFLKTLKATSPSSSSFPNPPPEIPSNEKNPNPVKLDFEKGKAYGNSDQLGSNPASNSVESDDIGSGNDDSAPGSVAGIVGVAKGESISGDKIGSPVVDARNGENQESFKFALEKAKEYKKNKGIVGNNKGVEKSLNISELEDRNVKKSENSLLSDKIAAKKEKLTVSNLDFVGLGFADKKTGRGLPPGLVPTLEPYPDGDVPEVEILVGDTSRFINDAEKKLELVEEDESDTYKPKVSTWGVFPRPSNISKAYGGGRVIRPGEQLETVEDKTSKQKRTRELISAYRKKIGLSIDPKLKLECEKALEEGDSLMDLGKLNQALPFYQEVMDKLPFQSELHGLAALQWSICQDSLVRSNEARVMYEKLQSHPTGNVSKRAKQFMFGFQAMEMLKVKSASASATNTGYQNFFEAFVDKKENYSLKNDEIEEQGEGTLGQAIPYIFFLVSPILFVLVIAVTKRV